MAWLIYLQTGKIMRNKLMLFFQKGKTLRENLQKEMLSTKFEERGVVLGHEIYDFCFKLVSQ